MYSNAHHQRSTPVCISSHNAQTHSHSLPRTLTVRTHNKHTNVNNAKCMCLAYAVWEYRGNGQSVSVMSTFNCFVLSSLHGELAAQYRM